MKDQLFLIWLHERLEHVHNESPCMDYMHKLRCIIKSYDKDKYSQNELKFNTLEELRETL